MFHNPQPEATSSLLDPKNHFDLMTTKFKMNRGGDGGLGHEWQVRSIRLKDKASWEYGVWFGGSDEREAPYTKASLVQLIEKSRMI